MAIEGEKKVIEIELEVSNLVKEIKGSYATGKTRSYEWRMSQLQRLLQMLEHHEQEIAEAIVADLSKPRFEALIYEVPLYLSLSLNLNLFIFSFQTVNT